VWADREIFLVLTLLVHVVT